MAKNRYDEMRENVMRVTRSPRAIAALSALALSFSSLVSPAYSANYETIAPNKSMEIDAHNTCRKVENNGSATILVPTKSASEWSSGSGAFLNNVGDMAGVKVSACAPSDPYYLGCYVQNNKSAADACHADATAVWNKARADGLDPGMIHQGIVGNPTLHSMAGHYSPDMAWAVGSGLPSYITHEWNVANAEARCSSMIGAKSGLNLYLGWYGYAGTAFGHVAAVFNFRCP